MLSNPEYNEQLQGLSMNDYAKVFNCSQKLEMDHSEARQLWLEGFKYNENYDKMTQFVDYAVQDVVVL